ncbi:MAG: sortase domain-containing protein [Marmoricola sp.]
MSVSRPPARRRRRRAGVIGLVLLLAGLGVLGWVAWEMLGTNVVSRHRADAIRGQTERDWARGNSGTALGILHVPRFGRSYAVPILEGFGDDVLAKGIAQYPQGAQVGRIGNYVLAAHRVTHGEPFRSFPDLRRGDVVRIETRTAVYTYRLRSSGQAITVDFHTSWPLWPVPDPDAKGRKPTRRVITLLTCSELFHTDNRSVVVGDLVSKTVRHRSA